MRIIKNYNDFLNERFNIDDITYQYIHNKITEEKFTEIIFSDILNENIFNDIKNSLNIFKEKIIKAFFTFITESKSVEVLSKLTNFISNIFSKLNFIFKGTPTLKKIFLSLSIMAILMCAGNQYAKGADNFRPNEKDQITAAIGYLQKLDMDSSTNVQEMIDHLNARVYLTSLIDNNIDTSEISEQNKELAKKTLENIKEIVNSSNDSSNYNTFMNYLEAGINTHISQF